MSAQGLNSRTIIWKSRAVVSMRCLRCGSEVPGTTLRCLVCGTSMAQPTALGAHDIPVTDDQRTILSPAASSASPMDGATMLSPTSGTPVPPLADANEDDATRIGQP